jgi:thiamine-phosphate pyrophosphorylase
MTFAGIYAIVDSGVTPEPLPILDAVLRGGVRLVQYRSKSGVDRALVREMVRRTRRAGAHLIVNDDLAAALDADGWHGGQEDLALHDVADIRRQLGSRILGVSASNPDEAARAAAMGADYLGVGPFASTASKLDAGPAIGAAGIEGVVRVTHLPVVAIGGIDAANLAAVFEAGAAMAAVISAIGLASDPEAAARGLVAGWRALGEARLGPRFS